MTADLGGREHARLFHEELVAPVVARALPSLRYAAGRWGSGSDVLELDDAVSRDHDWGARLTLLVDDADAGALPELHAALQRELPETFAGRPVRFGVSWDQTVTHNVECATAHDFAASRLGVPVRGGIATLDWLAICGQGVLEATGGPPFRDDTTELAPLREQLRRYPADVERYVLVAGWRRLGENLHLLGRAGDRGDGLGWRMIAADLVTSAVLLTFHLSRAWPPYPKWREALLGRLPLAGEVVPHLDDAMTAPTWQHAEDAIARAAEVLALAQRGLGLPAPDPATIPFFDRPYRAVPEEWMEPVLAALGEELRGLPTVGSIDHWVSSFEVLARPERRHALVAAYREWRAAASSG